MLVIIPLLSKRFSDERKLTASGLPELLEVFVLNGARGSSASEDTNAWMRRVNAGFIVG
jgi:hypothetical protein